MSDQSQAVQHKVVENITPELFAQLRKVPILSSLKDDELHCVEGVGDIHLDKDEFLVHQGEAAHFFWILLEGEIRVFQSQSDGNDGTIYKIESGNAAEAGWAPQGLALRGAGEARGYGLS